MLFQKLRIKDFRPYYAKDLKPQEIIFSNNNKNITLIKAENGTGKTTLLEAFKWCFYGKRLTLPNPSIFVNEKAGAETPVGDNIDVYVEVEFKENNEIYKINRTITFKKKKNEDFTKEDQSFTFWNLSTGEMLDGSPAEEKVKELLPEELNFFFDGERLNQMESKTEKRNEIINVLGIKAYENAIKDLGKLKDLYSRRMAASNQANQELNQLVEEEKKHEKQLEIIDGDIEKENELLKTILKEIESKKAKRSELIDEIANSSNVGAERKILDEKKSRAKKDLDNAFIAYKKSLGKKSAVILGREIITDAYKFLDSKRKEGKIPSNIKETLIDDLIKLRKCLCGNEIGEVELSNLLALKKDAIDEEFENHFYNVYNRIKRDVSIKIDDIKNEIFKSKKNFLEKENDFSKASEEYASIDAVYSKEDEVKSEILKDIEINIGDKTNQVRRIEINRGRLIQQKEEFKSKLRGIKNKIQNETKKLQDSNSSAKSLKMTNYLIDSIKYLYSAKLEKENKDLNKKIKRIYDKVTRKGYQIELDKKFELKVYKSSNIEKSNEAALSTGETKMVTLCFIGALVDLARELNNTQEEYDAGGGIYPIVLDSPYGDLDTEHKREMTETIQQLSDQIIIFASSSQWSKDVEEMMEDKVGITYELNNKNSKNSSEKYEFTMIEGAL
jgi:DNA sulfur modification protein DndD